MARDQRAYSRRRFCWMLASVLVTPGIAIAQTSKAVRRIGVLGAGSEKNYAKSMSAFRSALEALGHLSGGGGD